MQGHHPLLHEFVKEAWAWRQRLGTLVVLHAVLLAMLLVALWLQKSAVLQREHLVGQSAQSRMVVQLFAPEHALNTPGLWSGLPLDLQHACVPYQAQPLGLDQGNTHVDVVVVLMAPEALPWLKALPPEQPLQRQGLWVAPALPMPEGSVWHTQRQAVIVQAVLPEVLYLPFWSVDTQRAIWVNPDTWRSLGWQDAPEALLCHPVPTPQRRQAWHNALQQATHARAVHTQDASRFLMAFQAQHRVGEQILRWGAGLAALGLLVAWAYVQRLWARERAEQVPVRVWLGMSPRACKALSAALWMLSVWLGVWLGGGLGHVAYQQVVLFLGWPSAAAWGSWAWISLLFGALGSSIGCLIVFLTLPSRLEMS